MQTQFEALLEILKAETACYREMQNILVEEEASISLALKTNFENLQIQKETLVDSLQGFESRRKRCVDQLSARYASQGEAVTVRQLARFADPVCRRRLLESADRLRAVLGDVQTKNRRNQRMINQNLGLVKGSLRLLSQMIEGSPVYRKPGTSHGAIGFQRGGGRFVRGSA